MFKIINRVTTEHILNLSVGLILISGIEAKADIQQDIEHVPPERAYMGQSTEFVFEVSDSPEESITDAVFHYRVEDQDEFQHTPVNVNEYHLKAEIDLPEGFTGTLYYFLEISYTTPDDEVETATYPEDSPDDRLEELRVIEDQSVEIDVDGQNRKIEYNIISPEPNELINTEEVMIAIALFYGDDEPPPGEFQLYMGGENVSDIAEVTPYMITYLPWALEHNPGWHWTYPVEVFYEAENGDRHEIASWIFISNYE